MLKRVREKDAKRKAEENENVQRPSKAQCDREERMAKVQIKAYWACFPLPEAGRQAEDIPVEEDSEEELMESMWQDLRCNQGPGSDDGSEQELIADKTEQRQQRELIPNCQQ